MNFFQLGVSARFTDDFFQPGEVVSRIAKQRRGAADCGPGPKRRAARHRFGPPLSRALQNAPCDGAKGAELVHTDVRGIRKTNNFHVGLDFFSGVFFCVASRQSS
jgi:hypothetical protein